MAEYTSSIELKAVTSQLDKKLGKVTKDLKGIEAQVKKTGGSFDKMTKKVGGGFDKLNKKLQQNKAAIAGIAVAIGGIALKGVSDFKKFEDGIAQIATLGVKDLKKVEQQLDSVRKAFGVTGAEATKGYYDVISAGATEGAQAMEQLTAATKLAKAGNTDLAGSINIVTSGMNIFGKSGETAATITDKLFLAVKFGKTTVEELGSTFGFVAPVIAAAGLGMDDYAASMAAVTAGGIQTNQATTGIKAVLSNLIKVTPKASKAAKRLGIDFSVAALKSKGLVGVMEEIKEKTKGDVTELGKLFDSIEAINTVAVLTSEGGMTNLKRNMEAMGDSAGTTAEALALIEKTASFSFGKFNQSLSILSKNIGGAVVPGLVSLANTLSPVVDFLANLIKQYPGIVKVTVGITALATSLAFLGGPLTLIIAGAGFAIIKLVKHFDLFKDGIELALARAELLWVNFWAGFRGMSIGGIFKTMFDNSVRWVGKMVMKIKDKIGDLWSFLVDPVKKAVNAVDKFFKDLWIAVVGNSYIPDMVQGIKDSIAELWGFFVTPIRQMVARVKKYFSDLLGEDLSPSETIKKAWNDLTSAITTGWDDATAAFSSFWTTSKDGNPSPQTKAGTLWKSLTDKIKAGWENATEAVDIFWEAAFIGTADQDSWFTTLTDSIIAGWNSATDAVDSFYTSVFKGTDGNDSWWKTVTDKIIAAWNSATVAVESFYSAVMGEMSIPDALSTLTDSIKLGWDNATDAVDSFYSAVFKGTVDNPSLYTSVTDKIKEGWDTAKEAVESFYSAVMGEMSIPDSFTSLTDSIKAGWEKATKAVESFYVSAFKGTDGKASLYTSLTTKIKSGWDTAKEAVESFYVSVFKGTDGQDSLWTVITDKIKAGWNSAAEAVDSFWDSVFTETDGNDTMFTTLAINLKTSWDNATKSVKDFWNAVSTGGDTQEASPHEGTSSVARMLAALAAAPGMIATGINSTNSWEQAMTSLGLSAERSLTGLNKLGKMDFGSSVRAMQNMVQSIRNINAALSDDVGSKNLSTDAKSSARAFQDATALEKKIRANKIAMLKTEGREILKIKLAAQEAELAKMRAANPKNLQRGFMSRFMFGAGDNMHTYGAKLNGMIAQLGKAFNGLGGLLTLMTTKLDKMAASKTAATSAIKVAQAEAEVLLAKKNLKDDFKPMQNKAQEKAAAAKGNTSATRTAALEAQVVAAEAKLAKATADSTKGMGTIAKAFAKLGTILNAMGITKMGTTLTEASLASSKMGPITKSFTALGKIMSFLGTSFATVVEQLTKISGGAATAGSKLANSKAVGSMAKAAKSGLNLVKIPAMAKVLGVIARRFLIPIFAIYDAFKGFTDLENLQANIPGMEGQTEFTTSQKMLSGASEAFGNFFNAFLDLGSMVAKYFGAEHMAEYLESIDLAPQFGKVFTIISNLFKVVVNIFKGIFSGGEDDLDESAFTKAIKLVGGYISDLFDMFVAISDALLFMTSGEDGAVWEGFKDIVGIIGSFVLDLGTGLLGALADAMLGLGSWAMGKVKDFFTGIWDWVTGLFSRGKDDADKKPLNKNGRKSEFNGTETQAFATGGSVRGPGSGTSDDIPAMLSNGEFVINAKATAQNRAMLETINNGGKLSKFSGGGMANGKSYQFLQFDGSNETASPHGGKRQGGKDSLNIGRTLKMFVNHLDQTNPKVQALNNLFEELKLGSVNLSEEDVLKLDMTRMINKSLLELSGENKKAAVVTEDTTGAIHDLGTTSTNTAGAIAAVTHEWEGFGKDLTGPIKQAFREGGSIGDGLKIGLQNMMGRVADKFLDRAFAPLEKGIDSLLNNLDNSAANLFSGAGGIAGSLGSSLHGDGGKSNWMSTLIGAFFSDGGMVPQYLATGGVATGHGPKGSDTVPAWLTPGEVVLNAAQQRNVAGAMGGSAANNITINISGNVDQRAINQIKNVVASDPTMIHQLNENGKRTATGLGGR